MYQEQVKELEEMLAIGITGKDVNKKMYKLRSIIKGPKTQPQERMAINDPEGLNTFSLLFHYDFSTKF